MLQNHCKNDFAAFFLRPERNTLTYYSGFAISPV